MTGTSLTYFQLTGEWVDVEMPALTGSTDALVIQKVSGYVDLIPRLPVGFAALINDYDVVGDGSVIRDTSVALVTVTARIWSGVLSTINRTDTPGMSLVANVGLGLGAPLVYDVNFFQVVYAEAGRKISNFSFVAPSTSGVTICLTDPDLVKGEYAPISYGGPQINQ